MARPRKLQPAPEASAESETAVSPEIQPAPEASGRITLASLGYKPGDVVSLHHINLLANQ